MKSIFSITTGLLLSICLSAQVNKTALLLIDIQEFYFPGGFSELVEPEKAARNASQILQQSRKAEMPIIHVQHKTGQQMGLYKTVHALENEKRIVKTEINSFNGTDLKNYLDSLGTDTIIIVGMQTHMCVEAATRAAYDYGFHVILIEDACATKNLEWNNTIIKAQYVHNSTLNTLSNYAEIMTTKEYLTPANENKEQKD